jgi:hypothetical protein
MNAATRIGNACCVIFPIGLAALLFLLTVLPILMESPK